MTNFYFTINLKINSFLTLIKKLQVLAIKAKKNKLKNAFKIIFFKILIILKIKSNVHLFNIKLWVI